MQSRVWVLTVAICAQLLCSVVLAVEDHGGSDSAAKNEALRQSMHAVLEETEVLKMLRDQAEMQDERLATLKHRLDAELKVMQDHFEEMFDKMHETEVSLEKSLGLLEEKVLGKVQKISEVSSNSRGSWKMPFFFLVLVMIGAAAFFVRMYKKATKHTHYL